MIGIYLYAAIPPNPRPPSTRTRSRLATCRCANWVGGPVRFGRRAGTDAAGLIDYGVNDLVVGGPVVAADDTAETNEDTAIDVDTWANDVWLGESDPEISIVSGPSHGSASVIDDMIHYTPDDGVPRRRQPDVPTRRRRRPHEHCDRHADR